MIAPVEMLCPLCGEIHSVPDARSFDPNEMGCNMIVGSNLPERDDEVSKDIIIETIRAELKRQYEEHDGMCHYAEAKDSHGNIEYIAVEGSPNLEKIAQRVLDVIGRS